MIKIEYNYGENCDGASFDSVRIYDVDTNKTIVSASAYPLYECPEDATLERDIEPTSTVVDAFIAGYKAALEGVKYELIETKEDD